MQKLVLQTTHHIFLESRHPEVTKNSNYVSSTKGSQKKGISSWTSKTRRSKLFKSKFGSSKHFRKWFGSYLELNNKCPQPLEITFFRFLQIFEKVGKIGKVRQSIKNCLNQNLLIGTFLENGFKASLSSKTNIVGVWKLHFFSFLQDFDWWSWNHFLGKSGKCSKLFKSKLGHRKLRTEWFWRYLKLKNECSVFCKFLSNKVETVFWESETDLKAN